MTAITAGMVSELRGKTDAPMMECKKALVEAEGNMERAEEILRVKLGSKAGKASSRIAAEGVVVVYTNGTKGAMVEVNSETDFVAKNDEFLALANGCAKLVAEKNPADVEALSALDLNGKTVEQTRADLIGKIGENMTIRRFVRFDGDSNLVSYLHGAKIGVVVQYKGDETAAKDVAMHVAAMKPVALSSADVPVKLIETERKVATEKALESGKPAEIATKMVDGAVAKFLKEVSLFDQPFVKNDKETVLAMLKSKSTEVIGFTMYIVGEGIEKKVDDFAAEVAAQVAAAQGQGS